MKTQFTGSYLAALTHPPMIWMGLRVALVVGSLLFTINHGPALLQGKMTKGRWISALLTYCVPYAVSIHGQYVSQRRQAIAAAKNSLEGQRIATKTWQNHR